MPGSVSAVAPSSEAGVCFTIGNQIPASEEAGYSNADHY